MLGPRDGGDRWRIVGLVGLCGVLFFAALGSNRALTDHEAHLGGVVKQMAVSGDWIVLRIGDHAWIEKPPLPHWLAGFTAWLLGGFTEWTMRLPFAVAGVIVVLLEVRLMSRLFGPQIGWLSGVVQATSVYMVMYARLAEADVMLQALFLAVLTVYCDAELQWSSLSVREQSRARWLFWLLMGATNLSKGIAFGAILLTFTLVGSWFLSGNRTAWRRWWSWSGAIVAIAIAAAWPVAVVLREPTAWQLWAEHTLGRAAGTLGYTQPWWYYLTQWPTQLLPWTPWLLIAAPSSLRTAWRERTSSERFCWWWFLGQMALLSCSSGKHHHYLLYALPALSPITAQGLLLCRDWLRDENRSWRFWTIGLPSFGIAALIAGPILGAQRPTSWLEGWVLLPLLGVAAVWLAREISARHVMRTATVMLVIVTAGHLYAQLVVMPLRDTSAADKRFLAEVAGRVPPTALLAACGSQEIARHQFYLNRPILGIWDVQQLPHHVLLAEEDVYVIARGFAADDLAVLGHVEPVLQSQFTRRETSPADRYTLFHIQRKFPVVQAGHETPQ